MEAKVRRADPALVESADAPLAKKLFEEACRFDFFQAVRLLQRLYAERQPVGRSSVPAREVVRFRTRASLDFPASEIHSLTPEEKAAEPAQQAESAKRSTGSIRRPASGKLRSVDSPPQMVVSFMGLTGPLGVLPTAYTELLIERLRAKDAALSEFLDLFNHRLISLFYRAWEKYRFPIAFEQQREDRFTEYLFDIIGLGTRGLRGRLSLPDEGLLCYGGLIAQRPHSASAVEATLRDYFGVPVHMAQFSGQWLKLDAESVSRLGKANSQLGMSTVAGARVWDSQSKFRMKFGPLTYREFIAFLPTGSAFKPAAELIRLLAGLEFDFDVQLILKAAEVPSTVLTTRAKRRPMLGWTSWLKTRNFIEDDSQVVLSAKN
jgi:type VI secretion system protein ImpH